VRYLYVGAASDVAPEDAAVVAARAEAAFGGPVRQLDLGSVEFAFDVARKQYASIPILEMLLRRIPEDGHKLLAVTGRDIFIPVLTFVFGHAQLGGRAGIVSLARLRQEFYGLPPDDVIFRQRAEKETLHEGGHMFGLLHCAERRCAMSLATSIRHIDMKDNAFCQSCEARLRKQTGGSL
jgi:archaemetzincin